MALDEPTETDTRHEIDGLIFVIEPHLLAACRPITVDYRKYGFRLESGAPGRGRC